MGRLGRKHKAGTGWNTRVRTGVGGLNEYHGNAVPVETTATTTVLPDDISIRPSSTDATRDEIVVETVSVSTVPSAVERSKKTTYLAPFKKSSFLSNPSTNPVLSATLEMQLVEYCSFLSGMAKHGSTASSSKSRLPNLVVKILEDKVIVTLELSDSNELEELQGTSVTVSLIKILVVIIVTTIMLRVHRSGQSHHFRHLPFMQETMPAQTPNSESTRIEHHHVTATEGAAVAEGATEIATTAGAANDVSPSTGNDGTLPAVDNRPIRGYRRDQQLHQDGDVAAPLDFDAFRVDAHDKPRNRAPATTTRTRT